MPKLRVIFLCVFLFAGISAAIAQAQASDIIREITIQESIAKLKPSVVRDTIPPPVEIDEEEDDSEEFSLDDFDKDAVVNNVDSLFNASINDLYYRWSTDLVNPYNVRLTDKADTTLINLNGYVHPMENVVTSEFGFRRGYRFHYGIDIRLKRGDPVYSAFDGVVRIARRGKGYGFFVVVRHYNGLETVYGHFSKLAVKPHDEVKAGDILGYGGSTGRSSGPHLHLEIRYLGVPINPRMIVDFDNYITKSDTLMISSAHFAYAKEIEQIRFWTVRSGDTLGRIAQRTGVSVSKLCQLNRITTKSVLRVGQRIRYT